MPGQSPASHLAPYPIEMNVLQGRTAIMFHTGATRSGTVRPHLNPAHTIQRMLSHIPCPCLDHLSLLSHNPLPPPTLSPDCSLATVISARVLMTPLRHSPHDPMRLWRTIFSPLVVTSLGKPLKTPTAHATTSLSLHSPNTAQLRLASLLGPRGAD